MGIFGWSYPAGAANDPNAPYNQDPDPDNESIREAFEDYSGPYHLYRMVYKYGSCGHTIGFSITGVYKEDNGETGPAGYGGQLESKTFYCNDLAKFGTWEQMDEQGFVITDIHVSSIVEGVDECTDTITIEWACNDVESDVLAKEFWQAIDDVEAQVDTIWMATHGCETCAEHFGIDEWGNTPVWTECPDCEGRGAVI